VTNEDVLLERAKTYDPGALSELYDRFAPLMYAYIYRRVGDAASAEDLTAELFVRVLQAIHNERAWRDSLRAWLYRIAHNLVIDHYRRRPPMPLLPLDESILPACEDDPADAVDAGLREEQLREALSYLTSEQQEVIALRFGEGMTTQETAQIMRKTIGAVEGLQRRATAALKRVLARKGSV
jgi:RNA polymerase sigma-70 factor (ECF subfamily)